MLSTSLATGLGKRVPSVSTTFLGVRVLATLLRKDTFIVVKSASRSPTLKLMETLSKRSPRNSY